MDDHRFDDLTRRLAAGTSRRTVVKGLFGALIGGLAAHTARDASAQRLPNGSTCTRATQCQSLKCADGVCCNATCSGQCESCASGTCLPVVGAPVGNRPACPGSGVCRAACDGVQRTSCAAFPGLDVVCADPVCEDGWQTTYGCGGNGTCHPTTTSCGLFLCNAEGTACRTSCQDDGDCVGAAFCANGVCQGDQPLGQPCTSPDQCQSGLCVDGVCCDRACGGDCEACDLAGQVGTCSAVADESSCASVANGICCGGTCVDAHANPNCGACGHACPGEQRCVDGLCEAIACLGPQSLCDPTSDECCQDEPTACEDVPGCGNDSPQCCHQPGGSCLVACECCGGAHCANGRCCHLADAFCISSDQCCSGVCCGDTGGKGTCCADGEECVNGTCQPGQCLGLDQFCDPNNNLCCQDHGPTFCEESGCFGSGTVCCNRVGGFCNDSCDCCEFGLCRSNRCCRVSNFQCDADDQCCSGVCCDGVCCNDFQACCNGACQADTEPCVGDVPMGGSCTETSECIPIAGSDGLICADGGPNPNLGTQCGDVCCTPTLGASCAPNNDFADCNCCGSVGCGCPETITCSADNVVCGGLLAECETDGDCLSGLCAFSGGPAPNCCHDLGGFCRVGINSACCGTIGCGSGSGPGTNAVCGGAGAPCTADSECDASQCLICDPVQSTCVSSCTPPATCGGGGVAGLCGTPGQGTCPTGADFCSGPTISCNDSSICLCAKKLDGSTVCARNGVCHPCTTDADCAAVQGAGSVCTDTSGGQCNCPRACQPLCPI